MGGGLAEQTRRSSVWRRIIRVARLSVLSKHGYGVLGPKTCRLLHGYGVLGSKTGRLLHSYGVSGPKTGRLLYGYGVLGSKTGRLLHGYGVRGPKRAAFYTATGCAVQNGPPFSCRQPAR